jgi:hypothetical protein
MGRGGSTRKREIAGTIVGLGIAALLGPFVGGNAGLVIVTAATTFAAGFWLAERLHGSDVDPKGARYVIGVLLTEGNFLSGKHASDPEAAARWQELLREFVLDAYGALALLNYEQKCKGASDPLKARIDYLNELLGGRPPSPLREFDAEWWRGVVDRHGSRLW